MISILKRFRFWPWYVWFTMGVLWEALWSGQLGKELRSDPWELFLLFIVLGGGMGLISHLAKDKKPHE